MSIRHIYLIHVFFFHNFAGFEMKQLLEHLVYRLSIWC
jgi:hypothetical protein